MAELDYQYIAGVVDRARLGDSDAFAELYAATYKKQYLLSFCYMKDEFLAQDALQETYTLALKNLSALRDTKTFVSWLSQINFRVCYNMADRQTRYNGEMESFANGEADEIAFYGESPEAKTVKVDEQEYILQQIMALPASESQVILLHYYKNIKLDDIAFMMEISKSSVKRYLASGKKRLAETLRA